MNEKTAKTMFSSSSATWNTPRDFYEVLDQQFHFDLDPAATEETSLCRFFYGPSEDGLRSNWFRNKVCRSAFLNPPFDKNHPIEPWIDKAIFEVNDMPGATVVLLVPARTETKWFVKAVQYAVEVRFIVGRLEFTQNGQKLSSAPFPSAVIVLKHGKLPAEKPDVFWWDWKLNWRL